MTESGAAYLGTLIGFLFIRVRGILLEPEVSLFTS